MKIILSSDRDEFWTSIVDELLDKDIQTTYWLGDSKFKNKISNKYFFHEVKDILQFRGLYSVEMESFDISSIGLNEYYTYLKILDRDSNIGGYSFSMRDRSLKDYLNYWYSLFKHMKPDAIIFSNVPHLSYDYPMYLVAKFLNIRTIIFNVTPYVGWHYLTDAILAKNNNSNFLELSKDIFDIKSDFKACSVAPYKNQQYILPDYIKDQINYDKKNKGVIIAKKIVSEFSRKIKSTNLLSNSQKSVRYDYFSFTGNNGIVFELSHFLIKEKYKRRLEKEYLDSVVSSVKIDEIDKYIYVPLHYQPEATTAPYGGLYADQIYMIEQLRAKLPKNVAIIVKEHYSQFSNALDGFRGRYLSYWDKLLNVENLYLAPMDYNQKKLIIDSLAVVTVTGTAGWEAIQYGKYSIVFGDSWYSSHPNAINFKNLNLNILEDIINKVVPPDYTDKFLDVFCKSLVKSDLHNISDGEAVRNTNNIIDSIMYLLNGESSKC